MATQEQIKEVAVQLANVAIAAAVNEKLTGEEKERKVIEFLVKLDDNIPMVNFIPNALEAEILDVGLDNLQAFFADHNPKEFVKKCFNRIKHLFGK